MAARPIECVETDAGCWVVTSHKPGAGGYVSAWVEGKSQRLHRWSWEQAHGETIRPGLMVLHSCDNPPCINPEHLRQGVSVQNTDDAIQRGRLLRGSRCHNAILTEETVYTARVLHRRGWAPRHIAAELGVYASQLSAALYGGSWQHVPFPDADGNPLPLPKWEHVEDIPDAPPPAAAPAEAGGGALAGGGEGGGGDG